MVLQVLETRTERDQLKHQLLETGTERDQLNGECHNWTRTKTKRNDRVVALQMN